MYCINFVSVSQIEVCPILPHYVQGCSYYFLIQYTCIYLHPGMLPRIYQSPNTKYPRISSTILGCHAGEYLLIKSKCVAGNLSQDIVWQHWDK